MKSKDKFEKTVNIKLAYKEAVVLQEFLTRFSDKNKLTIEHQSEERVLWDICCILERELGDHTFDLNKARDAVKDPIN